MRRLSPEKLHVTYLPGIRSEGPVVSRRYTITHSDITGDIFLTIGTNYNLKQISGWYTRFMRDEVLAEWKAIQNKLLLHVYCHVSRGLVFGRPGWLYAIFRGELPLILETIQYGDRILFTSNPELDNAQVMIHFKAS